jgi:hypothetical protein
MRTFLPLRVGVDGSAPQRLADRRTRLSAPLTLLALSQLH